MQRGNSARFARQDYVEEDGESWIQFWAMLFLFTSTHPAHGASRGECVDRTRRRVV
jgi:hypothetical protein